MAKYKRRKDGRYETTISTGQYDDLGNLISKHVYGRTVADVDRKLAKLRSQLDNGIDISNPDLTVGEYAQNWLRTYKANVSINTRAMYGNVLKNHLGALNDIPIKKVRHSDLQEVITDHADRPRLAEQIKITMKQIFDCAVVDDIIIKSPYMGKFTMPRHVAKEKRALTDAEKDAVRNANLDIRHRAFLFILYCTGLRPAECYALTWSDIDLKNRQISVNKSLSFESSKIPHVVLPKTNSGIRTVPIVPLLHEILTAYKHDCSSVILFSDSHGNYMNRSYYNTMWTECKRAIDHQLGYTSDISAYVLRHTFCTSLYYSDVSMKEAQRLMGHASFDMIMKVYSHLDAVRENTSEKMSAINF